MNHEEDPYLPMDDDDEVDLNPYAAPKAKLSSTRRLSSEGDGEDEQIRRQYLKHEASFKSVGVVSALSAYFTAIVMVAAIGAAIGLLKPIQAPAGNPNTSAIMGVLAGVYFVIIAIEIVLAIGLLQLQTWARWISFSFAILSQIVLLLVAVVVSLQTSNPASGFCGIVLPSLISIYVIIVMVSNKSNVICSPDYREIMKRTPQVKYKVSIIVWIGLFLLVVLMTSALISVLFHPA